jgi:hypothetical protein
VSRLALLCLLGVVAAAPAVAGSVGAGPAPKRPPRIYVAPVQAPGVDDAAAATRTLGSAIEVALHDAVPGAELVTGASLDAVVQVNDARDCLAVDGVASCLSELADALDVDYLARPQYGRLGSEHVLSLSLIDGRRAVVVAQAQRVAGDVVLLLDAIPGLARDIAADAGLVRPPSPLAVAAAVAGVGVVVGGAGAIALGVQELARDEYLLGNLDAGPAGVFEATELSVLYGGLVAVGVGVVAVVVAAGLAGVALLAPEDS